jgi:FkbM family methyltransferase
MTLRNFIKKIPIIRRMYPSLMKRIYKNKKIRFQFFNINLVGNINEPMDKEIFLFNTYENNQIIFLLENINKFNPEYFLDIGANSGIYSLIISNKFKNIKIKSFEPVAETIKKFQNNLKLNNKLKNIRLYKYGLSNKNLNLLMKAQIRNNYIQSGGYGVVRVGENLDNLHVEKNLFKIGDNVIKLKNKKICIKIDTEGHENEVLQGLKKLLTRNKIFLQIEIFKENFKKINYILKKLKFRKTNSVTSDGKTDYYYVNY